MFCTKCGKVVEAGNTFCPYCGAPRTVPSDEQPTQPVAPVPLATDGQPPRRRKGLIAVLVTLAVLAVAGGVTAAVLLLTESETPPPLAATTTIGQTESTAGPTTTVSPPEVVVLVDLALRTSDIQATSVLPKVGSITYYADNLVDGDPATCWSEGVPGYGEGQGVLFTWEQPVTIYEVRIIPGYDKFADGWDRWYANGRVRAFDLLFSDGASESFTVDDDLRQPQTLMLDTPHTVTSVRFVVTDYGPATDPEHHAEDTSVAELHFWGTE